MSFDDVGDNGDEDVEKNEVYELDGGRGAGPQENILCVVIVDVANVKGGERGRKEYTLSLLVPVRDVERLEREDRQAGEDVDVEGH